MGGQGIRSDVWAAFRACRLWHNATDGGVEALANSARIEDVPRGTTIASEGEPADEFGLMVAGRARVFHLAADGKQVTLETVEASEPFAAVAALAGGRYPANIDAATPATIAYLPADALFALTEREPQVSRAVISDLASRVVAFTAVVQTLSQDVLSRLAGYLFQRSLESGRPVPGGLKVDLGMKKSELAMALGTVPETLSRAFAKLRDDEVLEVQGSTVTIRDVRALASLASGYDEG